MKTRKIISPVLLLAMAMVLAAFAAGCGTYQVQGKYSVGPPVDQQAPTEVVDANGNVRTKPAEAPTADLFGLGDVRFGQRSYQGAGTLSTPAKQIVIREKRVVREETYQDKRGCPDKSQIKEVKTGDVKRTETYARTVDVPAETVPLNTTLSAGDGPGTVLLGKAIDAGGNFASHGLYGLLRRPDRTNVRVNQSGGGADVKNLNLNDNTNINNNEATGTGTASSSSTSGAAATVNH